MSVKFREQYPDPNQPGGLLRAPGGRRWAALLILGAVAAPCILARPALGQADAEEEVEIPAPQEVFRTTQDGVELALTYYPPIKPGKDVVPIVLLHQFKGSQRDYADLASLLQSAGHAVVLPDLRGHGRSTSAVGVPQRLDPDKLPPAQLQRMVRDDMETINQFLWDRNNDGELNVNKLCLVGAEMGASVALLYAADDWTRRDYGPVQLGRFVKAIVLISPQWSFKGLSAQNAMRHPAIRTEISVLVATGGRRAQAVREAKRIYDMLKPHRPDPAPNRVAEEKDLFYASLDTALQGTDILGQGLNLEQFIAQFIQLRLVKAPKAHGFEWAERRLPHR